MHQIQGLVGVVLLLFIAWALSADRRRIDWRLVIVGLLAQVIIAAAVLTVGPVKDAFAHIAAGVTKVISFADAGTAFIFGQNITDPRGAWGFIFAVKVLPVIIFFSALMAVLYHLGVMQRVVAALAWVLRRSLRITGAEALSASANVFVGQTEAPLTVKPYIAGMTRSQLMCVMTGGFATIAGSVLAAYVGLLGLSYAEALSHGDPALRERALTQAQELFAKHLLTASIMSAPAGIVFAKILLPESEQPRGETVDALMNDERTTANVVDAAAAGASDGLKLALNVAAMLCAFAALLALLDWPLTAFGKTETGSAISSGLGLSDLSLRSILGGIFRPIAWSIGVPAGDAMRVGSLLGTQVVMTEFVAYSDLSKMVGDAAQPMSPRSFQIATYALCGFANIPSIGIQIGGLSAMAPERRSDLARIAPRAMIAGALACWMTGAVASLFIPFDAPSVAPASARPITPPPAAP